MQLLLAYLNSDHEYALFDPLNSHTHIHKISRGSLTDLEETGVYHFVCLSSCLICQKLLCISVSGLYYSGDIQVPFVVLFYVWQGASDYLGLSQYQSI